MKRALTGAIVFGGICLGTVISGLIHKPNAVHHATGCIAVDGDTLHCDHGLRLRLNGIDAPEMPGHCRPGRACVGGDPNASQLSLGRMIRGRSITYRALKLDRYGRTVAQVSADGSDLSCSQIFNQRAVYVPRWDEQHLTQGCVAVPAELIDNTTQEPN